MHDCIRFNIWWEFPFWSLFVLHRCHPFPRIYWCQHYATPQPLQQPFLSSWVIKLTPLGPATIWTNLETCPMPTFIRSDMPSFGDPESISLRATAYFLQLWNGISSVNPSSGFIVSSVAGSFGPTRQKGSRWQFPAGNGRSVSFWPPKVVVKERVYMDW